MTGEVFTRDGRVAGGHCGVTVTLTVNEHIRATGQKHAETHTHTRPQTDARALVIQTRAERMGLTLSRRNTRHIFSSLLNIAREGVSWSVFWV